VNMPSTHKGDVLSCCWIDLAACESSPSLPSSSSDEPEDQPTKIPLPASLLSAAARPAGKSAAANSSGPLATQPAAVYTCSGGSGGERVGAGGQRTRPLLPPLAPTIFAAGNALDWQPGGAGAVAPGSIGEAQTPSGGGGGPGASGFIGACGGNSPGCIGCNGAPHEPAGESKGALPLAAEGAPPSGGGGGAGLPRPRA
jgi:hypothetical protein